MTGNYTMVLKELEKRQVSEEAFHDRKFSSIKSKKSYYDFGFKSIVFNRMMNKIGDMQSKRVAEFGCGDGWITKKLAEKGAEVWTFDISNEAVGRTRALVNDLDLQEKVHVSQMPAEKLKYDSDMFDLIVGNAILHHVDLVETLKEIRRVLKRGGRAYFTEPLGHNPVLNLYRKMTPSIRSKDEMPMRFEQFSLIEEYFPKFEHEEYYLTAIFSVLWHFIGINTLMLKSRDILFKMDEKILHSLPSLRKYCWYSILKIEK